MTRLDRCILTMLLAALSLLPSGCGGCGFDCSGSNNNNSATRLTLGFSDALPEDLDAVEITVESIIFRRSGNEDIVVDSFTIAPLNDVDSPEFQMNLLDYQGDSQLDVITDFEIPSGFYREVSIVIAGNDINASYVTEAATGRRVELNVPGGSLNLKDLSLPSGEQIVAVEFALAQALEYQSDSQPYLLTTTGIRMQNHASSARLWGLIDRNLFDEVEPCSSKEDPTSGNRLYLYEGKGLEQRALADVYTAARADNVPPNAIAPFAVASIVQSRTTSEWEYAFGYLPDVDYTIALSCNTSTDNSITYEGLEIPLPTNQVYEVTLDTGARVQCNLTSNARC